MILPTEPQAIKRFQHVSAHLETKEELRDAVREDLDRWIEMIRVRSNYCATELARTGSPDGCKTYVIDVLFAVFMREKIETEVLRLVNAAIVDHIPKVASVRDFYLAPASQTRDRVFVMWMQTHPLMSSPARDYLTRGLQAWTTVLASASYARVRPSSDRVLDPTKLSDPEYGGQVWRAEQLAKVPLEAIHTAEVVAIFEPNGGWETESGAYYVVKDRNATPPGVWIVPSEWQRYFGARSTERFLVVEARTGRLLDPYDPSKERDASKERVAKGRVFAERVSKGYSGLTAMKAADLARPVEGVEPEWRCEGMDAEFSWMVNVNESITVGYTERSKGAPIGVVARSWRHVGCASIRTCDRFCASAGTSRGRSSYSRDTRTCACGSRRIDREPPEGCGVGALGLRLLRALPSRAMQRGARLP